MRKFLHHFCNGKNCIISVYAGAHATCSFQLESRYWRLGHRDNSYLLVCLVTIVCVGKQHLCRCGGNFKCSKCSCEGTACGQCLPQNSDWPQHRRVLGSIGLILCYCQTPIWPLRFNYKLMWNTHTGYRMSLFTLVQESLLSPVQDDTDPQWDVLFLQWADTGLWNSPHTAQQSGHGWTPSWSCSILGGKINDKIHINLSEEKQQEVNWGLFAAKRTVVFFSVTVPGHLTSMK